MSMTIANQVLDEVGALPIDLQRRVLEFARSLAASTPRRVSGKELMGFAGAIPADDLATMKEAIEQGCEQVDVNGW